MVSKGYGILKLFIELDARQQMCRMIIKGVTRREVAIISTGSSLGGEKRTTTCGHFLLPDFIFRVVHVSVLGNFAEKL